MAQRALQAQRVPQATRAQRDIRDRLLPHIRTPILGPARPVPSDHPENTELLER